MSDEKIQQLKQRVQQLSELTNRAKLASRLGMSYSNSRDLYQALGYELTLDYSHYAAQYARQDIASAIINKPVSATWRGPLGILESDDDKETPLEKAWTDLEDRLSVKSKLTRLDRLSCLGNYGVLLFGLDDVKDKIGFTQPVSSGKRRLLYLKPLSQGSAEISTWDEDPNSERYGLPLHYQLTLRSKGGDAQTSIRVHYSRVMHVAGFLLESESEGVPALKAVFNRLKDLEKIVGGSGEMFWRGARPGYQGKVDPEYQMTAETEEALQTQIDEYEHNLRRILVNEGVDLQSLASQVASPSEHVDAQIKMISAATGIPKRMFTGSERGELASTQDRQTWHEEIQARREEMAEPCIARPFVDKCIEFGILPPPKDSYSVTWQPLGELSSKEKAEISKTKSEAIKSYASAPQAQDLMPPDMFFRFVMGMEEEEIELITEAQEAQITQEEEDFEEGLVVPRPGQTQEED